MNHTDLPAPGATAPSAALSTSQGPGAGLSVEDSRRELLATIGTFADGRFGTAHLLSAIDAFASAVRAEALAPREPSPELADALHWLNDGDEPEYWDRMSKVILGELDRLRAQLEALREDVRRLLAVQGVRT